MSSVIDGIASNVTNLLKIVLNFSQYLNSAQKLYAGDSANPLEIPSNINPKKTSQTLDAQYNENQAIPNGTLTKIIVFFRPSLSV